MKIDKEHCLQASRELGEYRDCTVRACAIATGIDYKTMHQYLKEECGRKNGHGLRRAQYHEALVKLGFTLTELEGPEYRYDHHYVEGSWRYNPKTGSEYWVEGHHRTSRKKVGKGKDYNGATVRSLAKELIGGTYLVSTDAHVLCIKDGEVHDSTKGRMVRIEAVHKVTS